MVRAEAREQHRRREDHRPGARPGHAARKGDTAPVARGRSRLTEVTVSQWLSAVLKVPVRMGTEIFTRMVSTRKPTPNTPSAMDHSVRVGVYS